MDLLLYTFHNQENPTLIRCTPVGDNLKRGSKEGGDFERAKKGKAGGRAGERNLKSSLWRNEGGRSGEVGIVFVP